MLYTACNSSSSSIAAGTLLIKDLGLRSMVALQSLQLYWAGHLILLPMYCMQNMGKKEKGPKKSKYGYATKTTDAVEAQLCAAVTVPLMPCSGRRRFYY